MALLDYGSCLKSRLGTGQGHQSAARPSLLLSVFKLLADGCLRCPCSVLLVALLSDQVLSESLLQFVPLLMFATLGYVWEIWAFLPSLICASASGLLVSPHSAVWQSLSCNAACCSWDSKSGSWDNSGCENWAKKFVTPLTFTRKLWENNCSPFVHISGAYSFSSSFKFPNDDKLLSQILLSETPCNIEQILFSWGRWREKEQSVNSNPECSDE